MSDRIGTRRERLAERPCYGAAAGGRMENGWVVCACLGLTVACANQSQPGSEERRVTSSHQTQALLGSGVSEEVLLSDPVGIPLYSEAAGPLSISADANGFLVTWFDSRENRGVNAGVAAQSHVVGTRVSNSGVVATPSSLILSQGAIWSFNGSSYANARSAFNGQHYLVAWHHLKPSPNVFDTNFSDPSEIVAVRVSTAGELLDATPFVVVALPGGDSSSVDAVLSNGSGFFVAWSGTKSSGAPGQVQSRTLSFNGSEPVLDAVTTYSFSSSDSTKRAFVFNGLGYVVASVDAGNTGFTVGALNHPASSDCQTIASPSIDAIDAASNGAGELLVAYEGRVVPQNGPCTVGTKAVIIGSDGLQKAPPISLGTASAAPKVSSLNGKYFVAGFEIDPITNLATPAGTSVPSTLACNATRCLAAVGTGVSRLSSIGAVLDDPPIAISSPAQAENEPHVTAGAGKYLAAWFQQTGDYDKRAIVAGRLDSTGASLDPVPMLIGEAGFINDVGFNGTDFVVGWASQLPSNEFAFHISRISPAGVLKDPTGITLSGVDGGAAMACAATGCLIAWSPSNGFSPPMTGVFVTRVAADGTLLDSPPLQVHPTGSLGMLAEADGNYVLEYLTQSSSSPVDSDHPAEIWLQKLDSTGHAVASPMLLSTPAQTLRPCGAGYVTRNFALVGSTLSWSVSFLDSNAQPLQTKVDLGGTAVWEPIPSASTDAGCAVAWMQQGPVSLDLYANVLKGDGTRLRPSALPIATDAFSEGYPALAPGSDGKLLAVYRHFIAQAPYGSFRIAARMIDVSAFAQGATDAGGSGGESTSGTGGASSAGASGGEPAASGGSLMSGGAACSEPTTSGGSLSTGGTSEASGSGGDATGIAGSLPTGGTSGGDSGENPTNGAGGITFTGGTTSAAGVAGVAASGEGGKPDTGSPGGSLGSGGASAAGGVLTQSGTGGSLSAGATSAGTPGTSGHPTPGSGGFECGVSSRRVPVRAALPIGLLSIALAGWRRSRRAGSRLKPRAF